MDDFAHLKKTIRTDNENGLQYRVTNVREDRTRKGFQIVVDRICLVGGSMDTIYAQDAVALTGPFVEPGDQSATVSSGLAVASERTVDKSTSARNRLFENAGYVETVNILLAEGVNPNFTVSSGIQSGKPVHDCSQAGVKRSMDSGEDLRRRS